MIIDFKTLQNLMQKPNPFEEGEALFWDDPYISKNMLTYHLDEKTDTASRSGDKIQMTVDFWFEKGYIKPGMTVLDLGCGPGLYAEKLSERGAKVVGIDFSKRSIDYAKEHAKQRGLNIDYRYMDFFDIEESDTYDAAIQVYGEINVFSPEKRNRLLGIINSALKKDSIFMCDVTTRIHRKKNGCSNYWQVEEDGFWAEGINLVLGKGFDYPEASTWADQYIVIGSNGTTVYRNWFLDYDLDTITKVMQENGFEATEKWNDLAGAPYHPEGEWIGLLLKKQNSEG